MEIWFYDKESGDSCLFLSDELMTDHIAQRVAEALVKEGFTNQAWCVEM